MTAATAAPNGAPTEAEIREVITTNARRADFGEPIYQITTAVRYHGPDPIEMEEDPRFNHVWSNLRPSEARRLSELLGEAEAGIVERFERETIEATVRACLTFAGRVPGRTPSDRRGGAGMTAPTRAEILEAIRERMPDSIDVEESIHDALRPIIDSDMAPAEVKELMDAVYSAIHTADHDYLLDLRRRVVAATVEFARAHPDIPRGAWRPASEREPVPA